MRSHLRSFIPISAVIRPRILQLSRTHLRQPQHNHSFTSTSHLPKKSLPPRPTLPDADLKHAYLKGSGPGGQKINKTSSAVQLTHLPTGIVVKSQATRSRSQNHTIARRILAEKIELLEKGAESRAAQVTERKSKKKRSREKKARRKYRLLEEGREKGMVEGVGVAAVSGLGVGAGMGGVDAAMSRSQDEGVSVEDVDEVDEDEVEEWDEDEDVSEEGEDDVSVEEQDLSQHDSTREHTSIK